MKKLKIMIVEDEIIVAKDLQRILRNLGYEVLDTFSSGSRALEQIEALHPDFILLDINLKTGIDGIKVAEQIHLHYHIPFMFITAFSDKATLDRAKLTEPYGYIIKPFEEDDIRSALEIAHYKYTKDLEVRNMGNRFAAALEALEVAVLITDANDKVTFMNQVAETLTGINKNEALGKDITYTMRNSTEETKNAFKMLSQNSSSENKNDNSDAGVMISDGEKTSKVHIDSFPIVSTNNIVTGCAFVLTGGSHRANVPTEETDKSIFNYLDSIYAKNSFFVKKDSRYVKVNFQDITWVEALDNYVIIKTVNKEQFILHSSMKDIELKLPQMNFARAHRSYIVALDKINALEENACLIDGNRIPIGKSHKDNLMSRLNMF